MNRIIRRALVSILAAALLSLPVAAGEPLKIDFKSGDDLLITGDLHLVSNTPMTPFIVLFHQAGWSRGEYKEIAPRLNKLGYNCLAIDARSGGEVNGVSNATKTRAEEAKLGMNYVDALPDLIAALKFARRELAKGPLIAWGSSYSSSLVLKIAGEAPHLVDGVLSFSPGEYFGRLGQPKDWIQTAAKTIACPVFITSAKNERKSWQPLYDAIPSESKTFYLPETDGNHGSRALWEKFEDSPAYWEAVEAFLAKSFPIKKDS